MSIANIVDYGLNYNIILGESMNHLRKKHLTIFLSFCLSMSISCKPNEQVKGSTVKDEPAGGRCTMNTTSANAASLALFTCAANLFLSAATGGAAPSTNTQSVQVIVGALMINYSTSGPITTPAQFIAYVSTALQNPQVLTALGVAAGVDATVVAGRIGYLNISLVLGDCILAYVQGIRELARQTGCAWDEVSGAFSSSAAVQAQAQAPIITPTRETDNAEECAGLVSRIGSRTGQYCASGLPGTYWYNSSIQADCQSCCERNSDSFRVGNTCNFSNLTIENMTSNCTSRCYIALGGS